MTHRVKMRADDYDVIGAVPRDLTVIRNFLKRDSVIKRLIDIEEELLQQCLERGKHPKKPKKKQQQQAVKNITASDDVKQPPKDPCANTSPAGTNDPNLCDPCRRLKTSVLLEELTKPANFNPAYKQNQAPYFDEQTVLGSALPVKFIFRKRANKCEAEKSMNLMCTNTEYTNVAALINCCDVMVWPNQRVAHADRVPVTMISGATDLTEYMLDDETIEQKVESKRCQDSLYNSKK